MGNARHAYAYPCPNLCKMLNELQNYLVHLKMLKITSKERPRNY